MAQLSSPSVVFVVPDKMGGMLNIIDGLVRHHRPDLFSYGVVLTHNPLSPDTRFGGRFAGDYQATLEYRLPLENLHAVLRRLRSLIPPGEGVLVANDLLELALASARGTDRTVIQILHGDIPYYYDLAARHEDVIDAFVVYGRTMKRNLAQRLPHRENDIFYLPYGLAAPPRRRVQTTGPLRLLFAGRFEHGQKGILDLPPIDRALTQHGVAVQWTMIGAGPDEAALRDAWRNPAVRFLGPKTNAEVIEQLADHDVFVLPTRNEGVPVALLEAMNAGLVPVVSAIESGVTEILADGKTALMPPVGDIDAFAAAIATLDRDRPRLEAISGAASDFVRTHHDIRACTDAYQELFARYRELRRPRPARVTVPYRTRLDQPWMPNVAVRAVRSMIRFAKGQPF
jgi:glycosyltransferase involved in cell wall biosynthesis